MAHRHKLIGAATAALAIVAPAAVADGARPSKGTFVNKSATSGGKVVTTRRTISHISIYCKQTRWDVIRFVSVRRDGSFRYRGGIQQYGPAGQPWGKHRGTLTGRFTSSNRVRITHRLKGRCGTATVVAKRRRG